MEISMTIYQQSANPNATNSELDAKVIIEHDNEVGHMTYLDLLTELQSLDEDVLLEPVTVYDSLDQVFLPVGRIISNKSTYLEV